MNEALQFLIVDDDELIRTVLRIALRRAGHAALEAAEPTSALELATQTQPDVVVCDYRLAWASGVQLLAEIEARAGSASRRVPAMILITGDERGGWPYPRLRKPFGADELLALVARLLEPEGAQALTR